MGVFDRWRHRSRRGVGSRRPSKGVSEELAAWGSTRTGVEAYVEPETIVTETTVLLVAGDGEWTRRRIGTARHALDLAKRLGVPVHDAARVGYPARMRAYNTRMRHTGAQE